MSLWIPVTIAAALFQTLRFVLQKTLATSTLSAAGATFARFVYSAPLVALLLAVYLNATGQALPALNAAFWGYGALGGLAQVLATVCVVLLFKARNFAVGITFKKTETILSVAVGLVLLGEGVSWIGFAAICLGVVGVLLLSAPPEAAWRLRDLGNRATGLGLASGLLFAISAVSYRAASLELSATDPLARAGTTLAAVTAMQMVGMALWLRWREAGQIRAVWAARRVAVWVGLMSMGGSFCWFLAFTLQTAAYVKALGQVELIFSALVTVLFFRERVAPREWVGIAVLSASIVALVLVI
ncbi:MAG: DMT family transporter [Pseudomonadota bacterium]